MQPSKKEMGEETINTVAQKTIPMFGYFEIIELL
jgi:hypothetical protein